MTDTSESCPSSPTIAPSAAPYDELVDPSGTVRPHWKSYFDYIDAMGEAEAKARWSKAKGSLQENGASYRATDGDSAVERPWRLSPIPLLVNASDWQQLARGVAQRARLLGCLLTDLYGPQRCLANGTLPARLVFSNPGFLRALHSPTPQRSAWLPLYAVDLIRAPNGQFMALEDSTQSPIGMGYALENRTVVAQALPELLRHCNIERLSGFFRALLERLLELAPHNRDAPRIVLLTPGSHSASYFEHAYLARHLGISLVQGEDLTVRHDRVFLKTLGGLQPIDVLLRRVHDSYCDPLELRTDSMLGVPGLLQALRTGNVASMNPLGTGILETPAFLPYLNRLCEQYLSEELVLDSVPTYYCGDPFQLEQALARFDTMVIKGAFNEDHVGPVFVSQLDSAARDSLRKQIADSPERFVAQEFVPASRVPIFSEGTLQSRACVLRCFAHCSHPSDYTVMPGGLALVASTDTDVAVSIQRGARSKDVWVISEESLAEETAIVPGSTQMAISRGGGDLPSRVADNLYWLGRYAERAEAVARLTRVLGMRVLESPSKSANGHSIEVTRLFNALHAQTRFLYTADPPADLQLDRGAPELEVISAVSSADSAGSLLSALTSTLRVGRIVRDRLSHDTLRVLASLEDFTTRCAALCDSSQLSRLVDELNQLVIILAAFSGLVMESMSRGIAWRFLDMGRRLERAISLVTLLRATLTSNCGRIDSVIEAVLEVADSKMTFRRRYAAGFQTAPTVDLLLSDDTNPRSIAFQLNVLGEHFGRLPQLTNDGTKTKQQRLLLTATTDVQLADIDVLCALDQSSSRRDGLVALLNRLGRSLPDLSDSLTETYLYHANVARHLRSNAGAGSEFDELGGRL